MDIREKFGKRIMFFDGGMGTILQERGLKPGELPEQWNIGRPEVITEIHGKYLQAGADIILSNTFGANRFKFENTDEIVCAGIANARRAAKLSGRQAYIALDIGPTGKLLKPMGTLDFDEAVEVFSEVVRSGVKAGADLILIETMSDTYELKAAVLAAKENSELPVIATVIFGENGKLLTGADPKAVAAMLEGLRVDALGINCGLGPEQMKPIFAEIAKSSSIPLVVNPNAGMPRSENGKTVYDLNAEEFAAGMGEFIEMGAWLVGGCCGTTPEHIHRLAELYRDIKPLPLKERDHTFVTSYSQIVELGGAPIIIGERINPTGKSKFKQALREGNMEYILSEGVKQSDSGAHILDVNVGLPEIDEPVMLKRTIYELQSILPLPLQIDTTNITAMEQAMRIYNGKPMINSVNGKASVMRGIFPLVQKYGGVVVGLTLDDDGIPGTVEGRLAIAEKIYRTAAEYGIKPKDIIIDALTMTLSTDNNSANITLGTVKRICEKGGRTILGVSNISFGLPRREMINAAFFTMALHSGLSAGIINPNSQEMRSAYDTFSALGGYDRQCMAYIERYADKPLPVGSSQTGKKPATDDELTLKDCIIKGLKEQAFRATEAALNSKGSMKVISDELVPALDLVGKGFESGSVFLPQLLMSAEAAKSGFEAIKEHLRLQGKIQEKKGVVILATVKGDIHDIGKNIVKVLLENYGYDVIDLGKDISPEAIVKKTVEAHALLVGLSALMTTTVVNMEETIKQLRKECPWCKIMVGGAVLTQEYANMIGADFYGKDAMQSVYYAEKLFSVEKNTP